MDPVPSINYSFLDPGLLCQADPVALLGSPLPWGLLLAAAGLWTMIAAGSRGTRRLGAALGGIGLLVMGAALLLAAPLPNWSHQIVFWLFSGTAVAAAAAAVAARGPVYTAIWFAFSLLGVAGLFVQQNAQFLGAATVVVYAGAIIVTFLFVLMLAQPDGEASYDRLTWAPLALPAAVIAATMLVALIVLAVDPELLTAAARGAGIGNENHMARLGAELFARHLLAVEVAGTLLLVTLVGAIAIVIHGRTRETPAGSSRGGAIAAGGQANREGGDE